MATIPTLAASAAGIVGAAALLDNTLGLRRDISQIRSDAALGKRIGEHIQRLGDHVSLYHLLELANPNDDALWFEGKTWSYKALKAEVDAIAVGLHSLDIKCDDFVALFMTNSPEMVISVFALSKLGAAPALVNSALRDDTLLHCINLASSKIILTTPDLASHAATAASSASLQTISLNLGSFRSFDNPSDSSTSITPFPYPSPYPLSTTTLTHPPRSVASVTCLMYTSGTSGKPKACSIKGMLACCAVATTSTPDARNPAKYLRPLRTYCCMPLFHGTTFFMGLCYTVAQSATICLSRRFSASKFWTECAESRATRVLYVGELCRFLVAQPPTPSDRAHGVIAACGNGLQRDVWLEFKRRFNIPEIREFYRSTEGLVKYDNRHLVGDPAAGAGKVGYEGWMKRRLEKDQFLVRFDYENETPARNKESGFCEVCDVGEQGEAIARVASMATYTNYHANPAATEGKLLRDVFEKGDVFQRSGDLLVVQKDGWVRFVDRIGDTYRWKGENVSAGEVRGYIADLDEVHDAIVVGKVLNGYDGQVGAAAVVLKQPGRTNEDRLMTGLYAELKRRGVPSYAVPRLVVMMDELGVGHTFKHAKGIVKAVEWDRHGEGRRYWLDGTKYVPLDGHAWIMISEGKAKL